MKIKNIIGVFALPALLMVSAVAFAGANKAEEAKAATDVGNTVFTGVRYQAANDHQLYLYVDSDNAIPRDWNHGFSPANDQSGVFVNGSKTNAQLKKVDIGVVIESVNVPIYFFEIPAASVGTTFKVCGTWTGVSSDDVEYTFTVSDFYRTWDGDSWEYALADFDKVSLAAANMPNFEYVAINTEDDAAYSYTSDALALPQKKGYFGLKNGTGSYSFEFNFKKEVKSGGWFEIRIGGTGSWGTGHFLLFKFSTEWNVNGCGHVFECLGNGDIWNPTQLNTSGEFATNFTGSEDLLEMGAIKVLGYDNLHYIFVKNNDAVLWSAYWELNEAPRTTRVGMFYGNADIKVTNSLSLNDRYQVSLDTAQSTATALYLNTGIDVLPPVGAWENYFIPLNNNQVTLNGTEIVSGHWNYFKKSAATTLFFGLGDLGVTPATGDVLFIGGDFKMAKNLGNSTLTLYRLYLYDYYFQFDGTAWREVNPDYEAADFAKELLKSTLAVCSASDEGNHDALADIWTELATKRHYGKLLASEVETLVLAEADKDIVVPDSEAGIDAMTPENAIKAAMYRYDFCTAKYNLTPFIAGRVSSLATSGRVALPNTTHNNTLVIVIIVTATSSLCLAGLILFRKRKVR